MNVRAVEEMCCCVFCGFAEWTCWVMCSVSWVYFVFVLCCKNGDLPVRSCVMFFLFSWEVSCSSLLMSGVIWLIDFC